MKKKKTWRRGFRAICSLCGKPIKLNEEMVQVKYGFIHYDNCESGGVN